MRSGHVCSRCPESTGARGQRAERRRVHPLGCACQPIQIIIGVLREVGSTRGNTVLIAYLGPLYLPSIGIVTVRDHLADGKSGPVRRLNAVALPGREDTGLDALEKPARVRVASGREVARSARGRADGSYEQRATGLVAIGG